MFLLLGDALFVAAQFLFLVSKVIGGTWSQSLSGGCEWIICIGLKVILSLQMILTYVVSVLFTTASNNTWKYPPEKNN